MRNPSQSPAPNSETTGYPFDAALNDLLTADYPWLDYLEPFQVEWELIWPM